MRGLYRTDYLIGILFSLVLKKMRNINGVITQTALYICTGITGIEPDV